MGFTSGILCLLRGLRFALATRRVRAFVAVAPALTCVALGALGWLATVHSGGLASTAGGLVDTLSLVERRVRQQVTAGSFAPAIAASLVVVSLIQPLSAMALDIVAKEQAWKLVRRAWQSGDAHAAPLRCVESTACALAVAAIPLVLLSVIATRYPFTRHVADLAALLVAGAVLAWNFLEYPLSQRDMGVGERVRWIRQHFAAVIGFGISCAILLFLPVVGLLVVPAGIAGATRLALECDGATRSRREAVAHPLASPAARRSDAR